MFLHHSLAVSLLNLGCRFFSRSGGYVDINGGSLLVAEVAEPQLNDSGLGRDLMVNN